MNLNNFDFQSIYLNILFVKYFDNQNKIIFSVGFLQKDTAPDKTISGAALCYGRLLFYGHFNSFLHAVGRHGIYGAASFFLSFDGSVLRYGRYASVRGVVAVRSDMALGKQLLFAVLLYRADGKFLHRALFQGKLCL